MIQIIYFPNGYHTGNFISLPSLIFFSMPLIHANQIFSKYSNVRLSFVDLMWARLYGSLAVDIHSLILTSLNFQAPTPESTNWHEVLGSSDLFPGCPGYPSLGWGWMRPTWLLLLRNCLWRSDQQGKIQDNLSLWNFLRVWLWRCPTNLLWTLYRTWYRWWHELRSRPYFLDLAGNIPVIDNFLYVNWMAIEFNVIM